MTETSLKHPKNPYAAVREAIIASGTTRLLAGVALDETGCGCAFGVASGLDPCGTFTTAMDQTVDSLYDPNDRAIRQRFRAWAAARGLTREIVCEIELYNDTRLNHDAFGNDPDRCAERLALVLSWLGTRAEAWEEDKT